jgi:polysaccharide biosynthesis/export protein
MAGCRRSLVPRSGYVCLVILCGVALCHLPLLAQTPAIMAAPQAAPPERSAAPPSNQSSSAQPSSPQNSAPPSSPPLANSNVRLGVGDLIEIAVFGVPDLSVKTRISGSGDVYLPLIDYVHVADLTTDEAQDLIQKRLEDGGFVRGPHVSIFVDESASQAIIMLGEIMKPGPYSAVGERRLYDMISAAGGLTDKAGRTVTIEHRGDANQKEVVQLTPSLADDSKDNVAVFPGDMIIVSRAGIVYVVGDVAKPSGFLIEDTSLSVLKALALAGGSTKTSSLGKTRILRETPNGVQEIPVDLKKMLYAKTPDIPLVKGDILFVPGSSAKSIAYATANAALSISTALAVVAAHP